MGWLAETREAGGREEVLGQLEAERCGIHTVDGHRNAESATYSGQREWRYVVESWSYRGEELDYLLV